MKLEDCKVGVRVVYCQGSSVENFGVITEVYINHGTPEGHVWVKWDSDGKTLHTHYDNLKIVDTVKTVKTTPHKHAEVIKAWADGVSVQRKYPTGAEWKDVANPVWYEDTEYRVKPEPEVRYKIGDRFKIEGYSEEYLLCQVDYYKVTLIGLSAGDYFCYSQKVSNINSITKEEFEYLIGSGYSYNKL